MFQQIKRTTTEETTKKSSSTSDTTKTTPGSGSGISYSPSPIQEPSSSPAQPKSDSPTSTPDNQGGSSTPSGGSPQGSDSNGDSDGSSNLPGGKKPSQTNEPKEKSGDKKDSDDKKDKDKENDQEKDKNKEDKDDKKTDDKNPDQPKSEETDNTNLNAPDAKDGLEKGAEGAEKGAEAAQKGIEAAETAAETAGTAAKAGAVAGDLAAEPGAEVAEDAAIASGVGAPVGIGVKIVRYGKAALDILSLALDIVWRLRWPIGIAVSIPAMIALILAMGIFSWFMGFGPGGSQNKETALVDAQVEPFTKASGAPAQVSREAISLDDPNAPTTEIIASSSNVSSGFKNFAKVVSGLEDELDQLANQEIAKADTSEEMIPLLEKIKGLNNEINAYTPQSTAVTDKPNSLFDNVLAAETTEQKNDDQQFYNHLKTHYLTLESKWLSLANFNEIFEYLLIQTGQGAEIKNQKVDDKALRASRQTNAGKMIEMVAERQKEFIQSSLLDDATKQEKIKLLDTHVATINSTLEEETKPRDEKMPPALEFANPQELAVLLPQNKSEYSNYNGKNIKPDAKIYYLLSYIFHVWEQTGEDYENYKKDNVIQQATTPGDIISMCGDKLENDPKNCSLMPTCGISQMIYAGKWLSGGVDNIGVPYKDRGHLKIWIGLDAPFYSDEKNQKEKQDKDSLNIVNTHYDLRAMDISEIGLYNERLDCAGCRGLQTCPTPCPEVPIPCCPILLDSAQDVYQPVQVQWAHNNFANNILGAATNILPVGDLNQFGITGTIGDLVTDPLNNLFGNIGLGNLDFYQLMNGDFTSMMSNIGQSLTSDLFGQLGLPFNFDPLNPNFESLVSNIGSNYLNQAFDFPGGSFTPIMSSLMSGDYQSIALDMFNRSIGEVDLPPTISNLISNSINSGNPTQAALYSLANTGLQQLNNQTFAWPSDVLDLSNLSGTGFTGISNRLGQNIFNKIASLPTANLFDPSNPQSNFLSNSASIISQQANNQSIANNINNQISSNQTPTLHSTLKSLSKEDLQNLLPIPEEKITKIYDYLQNPDAYPGGHSAFVNDIKTDLDYAKLTQGNLNLNEYSLKNIIEKGTSPALGDEYALSALTAETVLSRIGATYSEEDAAKLPYLLNYIAAENQNNSNLLNQIEQKFQQNFTQSSETISAYRNRIINTINNAAKAQTYINYYQTTIQPIKLSFTPSDTFYLLTGSSGNFDYQDTTYLLDFGTNQDFALTNLLHQQKIDLRSLVYVSQTDYENQNISDTNRTDLANLTSNTTYYAYPQINLAEIIVPGINPNSTYHNNLGAFKLLETTTYVLQKSKEKPAQISIFRPGGQPNSTTADPYETAFKNKYLLSIKNADGTTQTVDYLAHLGGTNYIYQTLSQLGQDQNTSAQNLANIGSVTTAYNLTGIDISNPADLNLNENQIKDLVNTMGIVNSWTTGSFDTGQNQMLNFAKQNNIFNNLSFQNSDIDFNNVFNSISSGNVYQTLNNIPLFQENYQSVSSQFGNLPIDQFYNNFIANPSPQNILTGTQDIMANYISANSGLDKITALQEISNTLGGDPKNFPKLFANPTLQNSVFKNVSPTLLNDISSIYGNILSGNLDVNTGLSMISTGGLIDRLAGPNAYSDLVGQYGGTIINALQNMSPQNIANLAFDQFSPQINNFLANNNLTSIFPNGLGQLFSGDIDQFVTNTAMNYLQNNLLNNLPANLQGPLFGNLQNLLNGNLSLSSLTQMAIPQLTSLLPDINLNLNNPLGDLSNGLNLTGGLTQGAISGVIGGLTSQIFEKCKGKIAEDNMIHLTDIILSYDRNRRTQFFYDIASESDGQLSTEDQKNSHLILPKFYWHQMFSEYPKKVFDKITKKATEKLLKIWPRDDRQLSDINVKNDVWKNDCTDRDNQFMTKCQDYIHINF
ncbi:MAG: hypothetical protein ACOZAR_04010 [Patescibacteria group bacterium]